MSMCNGQYTEKPWGGEWLIETNDKYSFKKLLVKKGEMCSLQYHKKKKETIFVLQGEMKIWINGIKEILKEDESITINPNVIHRMEGITDCWYLEASTSELDDVVRLEDKYGR